MDVFGAGFDTPRGKRIGGQSGFEPFGERLRRSELTVGIAAGHGGDFEKSTRAERERDQISPGEERSGG